MTTATFTDLAPSSSDLAASVRTAIRAVRTCGDSGAHRAKAVTLAHRWVAQQDRADVVRVTRQLDAWVLELNAASRGTAARPVVRVGLRLRTAGF